MLTALVNLSEMSADAVRQLVQELWQRRADLEHQIRKRDAEIARLKGLAGRPVIKPATKPSGMEAGTQPAQDRPARRQVFGRVTPLAARLQHVQHAVQHRPKIDAAVPATAPRRRDERLDDPPFHIAQVARIVQPSWIVEASVLRCRYGQIRLLM